MGSIDGNTYSAVGVCAGRLVFPLRIRLSVRLVEDKLSRRHFCQHCRLDETVEAG